MKSHVFFIVAGLLFASCHGDMQKTEAESSDTAFSAEQQAAVQHDIYSDGKTEMIKTLDYRFEVKDLKETENRVALLMMKFPAFVQSSQLSLNNPILENKMVIRVRNDYFDDFIKAIDKEAIFVNFKNVNAEDVSKQFVDLESRLRTKKEVHERYTEILRRKAGNVKDLLEAEKQIGELQEEIEATVSRINFLRDQVRYSTINLEFYQRVEQTLSSVGPSTGVQFRDAFKGGYEAMVTVFIALAYLWPAIIGGILAFVVIKFRKRKALAARM
jgi:hypothetical protein